MHFSELLRKYMDSAGINATQLAEAAGISVSSVSRYLNGKQIPSEDVIRKLADSLESTVQNQEDVNSDAHNVQSGNASKGDIFRALHRAATGSDFDYDTCRENLRELLSALEVSNNDLARLLSYDPSHISRILNGSRRPSSPPQFLSEISSYLGRRFYDTARTSSILSMTGCETDVLSADELSDVILNWLGQPQAKKAPQIAHFLDSLDEFDLNDFMASIHFDDIKVPTMPLNLPGSKTYTGIEEMMQAEIDFLKYAVLSKSNEDIILYSDMPMEEMYKDPEFPKKWMMGMALMIRKGLNLRIIHDVHRPLPEMLLGLESWTPMYMTGQVHPYYLKDQTNHHFMHFIRSAGTVAISGEAIFGHHASGRYTVTRNKEDVDYYRQRAKDLLGRAETLMEIYKKNQAETFRKDLSSVLERTTTLHSLSNVPPLFTMSEELLDEVLAHNDVSSHEVDAIKEYHRKALEEAAVWLSDGQYMLELSEVKHEDYADHPARLPISELFTDAGIRYSEDEYRRHIEEAIKYAGRNPKFSISSNPAPAFRNIDITIAPGQAVLVSKSNPPIIHFLIFHPQLISAFEQFAPLIIE